MKKLLVALILLFPSLASAEPGIFAGDRADIVPQGRVEAGILESTRYGLTPDIELYTHPLLAILVPHLGTKISWSDDDVWRISSRHELSYPSWGLSVISGEGAGGFLPADQEVPQLLVLDTELIMTMTTPLVRRFLTFGFGFEVAPKFSGPDVAIEAPIFYPRTAVYTSGIVGHARVAFSGELAWDLGFDVSASGYFLPEVEGFVTEQEYWIDYPRGDSWRLRLGMLVSTGWYPQGVRAHQLPLIDVLFAF